LSNARLQVGRSGIPVLGHLAGENFTKHFYVVAQLLGKNPDSVLALGSFGTLTEIFQSLVQLSYAALRPCTYFIPGKFAQSEKFITRFQSWSSTANSVFQAWFKPGSV